MMQFDKKKLRREIDRARRQAFRARLLELRELIAAARVARNDAILGIKSDCALKRRELNESCRTRQTVAKASGNARVSDGRAKLLEERGFESKMRAHERPRRLRSTTGERRQESDDEVRSNLEPAMVRVFDAVRKQIKGTPRKSRTEAFMQWAEENPGEVFDLLQHDADRYLAQLLAEEERTRRELRRSTLAGVPF